MGPDERRQALMERRCGVTEAISLAVASLYKGRLVVATGGDGRFAPG
jgi:hypothetical protein